jgi:hypothetical protein
MGCNADQRHRPTPIPTQLNVKVAASRMQSLYRLENVAHCAHGDCLLAKEAMLLHVIKRIAYSSSVIASPLRSAFASNPTWLPLNSNTAPFWLVSTIARAPVPTARPTPAAP